MLLEEREKKMVFVAAPNSSEKEVYDLLFSWETQHVGSQEEHSSLPLSVLASLGCQLPVVNSSEMY